MYEPLHSLTLFKICLEYEIETQQQGTSISCAGNQAEKSQGDWWTGGKCQHLKKRYKHTRNEDKADKGDTQNLQLFCGIYRVNHNVA